jgi:hypothetical protein
LSFRLFYSITTLWSTPEEILDEIPEAIPDETCDVIAPLARLLAPNEGDMVRVRVRVRVMVKVKVKVRVRVRGLGCLMSWPIFW